MPEMSNSDNVAAQYADDKNLSIRIKLHAKYSTNRYGLYNWIHDRYQFFTGCRVLELGCGTGSIWEGRLGTLPEGSILILTDLSSHMAGLVWQKYAGHPGLLVQKADIQDIPFPPASLDFVIANYMLYHVPDLPKALSEVSRVLKPKGTFYAATNGVEGMSGYLHRALRDFNPRIDAFGEAMSSFTLQNGAELLRPHFRTVEASCYEDALRITGTQDLMDWILSTITLTGIPAGELSGLYDYFEGIRAREGAIHIPKQTGLFTAQK